MNLFVCIIMNTSTALQERIIKDLKCYFIVHKIIKIKWNKEKYNEECIRLLGEKISAKKIKKDDDCIFTVLVFEDKYPLFSDKIKKISINDCKNIHCSDKINLYKSWGLNSKQQFNIYISDTLSMSERYLTLLFGYSLDDFESNINSFPELWEKDIIGTYGWNNLEQFFYVLNHTCKYVVLRNFENLPTSFHYGNHEDIDILAEDFNTIVRICNAKLVYKKKYRVQCLCNVSDIKVQFDFRFIGDNYYDKEWEINILNNRIIRNGIYVPDEMNYPYMLMYHALIHKPSIAQDYIERLDLMFSKDNWSIELLSRYINENNYSFCEPTDLSVYYNAEAANTNISYIRKWKLLVHRIKERIKVSAK